MKIILAIVILLSANITACGYQMPDQNQQGDDELKSDQQTGDNQTEDQDVDSEKPEKKAEKKKPTVPKTKDGNNVEVNVNVDVNVTQVNGYEGKWLAMGAPATLQDAALQAPDGYRLPTRTELIQAFDAGEFEGMSNVVWSSSEVKEADGYFYGINLGTGTQYEYNEGIDLYVLYTRD